MLSLALRDAVKNKAGTVPATLEPTVQSERQKAIYWTKGHLTPCPDGKRPARRRWGGQSTLRQRPHCAPRPRGQCGCSSEEQREKPCMARKSSWVKNMRVRMGAGHKGLRNHWKDSGLYLGGHHSRVFSSEREVEKALLWRGLQPRRRRRWRE